MSTQTHKHTDTGGDKSSPQLAQGNSKLAITQHTQHSTHHTAHTSHSTAVRECRFQVFEGEEAAANHPQEATADEASNHRSTCERTMKTEGDTWMKSCNHAEIDAGVCMRCSGRGCGARACVTSLVATSSTGRMDDADCTASSEVEREARGDIDKVSASEAGTGSVADEEAGEQHLATSVREIERPAKAIEAYAQSKEVADDAKDLATSSSSPQYDGEDALTLPEWIRVNFPHVSSGEELKQLELLTPIAHIRANSRRNDDSDADSENLLPASVSESLSSAMAKLCEECGSRHALLRCAECDQRLCFQCADAIHIVRNYSVCRFQHTLFLSGVNTDQQLGSCSRQIPSLARHIVRLSASEDVAELPDFEISVESRCSKASNSPDTLDVNNSQCKLPPAAPIVSPRNSPAPVLPSDKLLASFDLSKRIESRLSLPVGTHVFFRSEDCGHWSRELLHGTVIHDDSMRVNSSSRFYYRLVWLRGVEVLPNGFFRASLELQAPPSDPRTLTLGFGSWWPQEIGVFPTLLSAFRAVVTAEAIARMKFRREQVSGRLVVSDFPSMLVMKEILEETDTMLSAEFKVRLSKRDDLTFLRDIGRGTWDYRTWMCSIGREEHLKEEDATTLASTSALAPERNRKRTAGINIAAETTRVLPWQPSTRIRFFLVEQQDLFFPAQVQRDHLKLIMAQMLHVHIGFAWKRWRAFVKRSRRHERQQRRNHAATRIQKWIRRLTTQWANEANCGRAQDTSLLALQLYQRRQVEAVKLYNFMSQQYHEKQRNALRRWAAAARLNDEGVRRHLEVREQTQWHPSYGIASLPKLPKAYAHKTSDGSLAIDDMKLYKQFRANHAGPTDMSYWIVRGRVLAGVYPVGKSSRDARRIVSRADFTTSVLLQEISVFICLAETCELMAFEREQAAAPSPGTPALVNQGNSPSVSNTKKGSVHLAHQASAGDGHPPTPPWMFERVVRSKYDALQAELRAAVKVSLRQVQLVQNELHEHEAMREESSTSELDETLGNKVVLAQQNAEKARKALETLTMELQFVHFPIPKDGVPDAHELELFLVRVEDMLRAKRNVYVFSMNGHGRTGFVAALLLGRLYGIASLHALELAQRLHDCQWSMHSVPSNRNTSSPKASVQISAVQRLLAHWDTIYAPITSENSAEGFHEWRAQQRGMAADPFMKKDGFMISSKPDASAASAQLQELRKLQRIAARESGAAQLVRSRQREAAARETMEREDQSSRQLQRLLSRRESLVTMELAMIGAVTATLDDLAHAVESQIVSVAYGQDADVESTIATVMEALIEGVIEKTR